MSAEAAKGRDFWRNHVEEEEDWIGLFFEALIWRLVSWIVGFGMDWVVWKMEGWERATAETIWLSFFLAPNKQKNKNKEEDYLSYFLFFA